MSSILQKLLALCEEYLEGREEEEDEAQHNGNKTPSKGKQRLDKWVNRLQERSASPRKRETHGSAAASALESAAAKQPAASVVYTSQSRVLEESKLARWVSRSATASPMPPAASLAADQIVASKLNASQAGGSVKLASSDAVELKSSDATVTETVAAASSNSSETAVPANKPAELPTMPEFSSVEPASHPYVNGFWASKPVAGSAIEAWMVRAAAKQLHMTWAEKRHDYCDEILLQRNGMSVEQIHAQRYHYSPPEINCKVSCLQSGLRVP